MVPRSALPRRHLMLLLGLALLLSLVVSPVAAARKLSSHLPRADRDAHRIRHHHRQRPRSPVRESRAAQPVKTRSPLVTSNTEPRNSSLQLERRSDNARFTFYAAGLGACGKVNKPSDFIVAINIEQWDHGAHCFETITMSYDGKKTDAMIVDLCPSCPYGALDLSEGLFKYFADPNLGIIYGSWDYDGASDVSKPRAKNEDSEKEPSEKSEKGKGNGGRGKTAKIEETGKTGGMRPVSKTAGPEHEHTAVRVSKTVAHSGPGRTAATSSAAGTSRKMMTTLRSASTSRKTTATSSTASASRKMETTSRSASASRKTTATSSAASASRKTVATSSSESAPRKTTATSGAVSASRPSFAHSTPTRHATKPTAASSEDVFGQIGLDPLPTYIAPDFDDDGDEDSEDPALETILEGISMDFGVPFSRSVTRTHSAARDSATQVPDASTPQDFNLAFMYLGQLIGSQTQSPEDPLPEFVAKNLEPRQS